MRIATLFITAAVCLGGCAGKTPVRIATTTIAAVGGFAIYHGATMDTTGSSFDDAFAKGSQQQMCIIGGALIAGLAAAVFVDNELEDAPKPRPVVPERPLGPRALAW